MSITNRLYCYTSFVLDLSNWNLYSSIYILIYFFLYRWCCVECCQASWWSHIVHSRSQKPVPHTRRTLSGGPARQFWRAKGSRAFYQPWTTRTTKIHRQSRWMEGTLYSEIEVFWLVLVEPGHTRLMKFSAVWLSFRASLEVLTIYHQLCLLGRQCRLTAMLAHLSRLVLQFLLEILYTPKERKPQSWVPTLHKRQNIQNCVTKFTLYDCVNNNYTIEFLMFQKKF